MVQYIDLQIKCEGRKAEVKINGRRIKSYSDFEEVLKTIDAKALGTLNNQTSMVADILCHI
ncbi:hypothetical protein BM127P2_00047 [Phocaeicola phage BM127P2]|nr:hypothetical protein BM127P1_00032 [Phocaeicola phage BM127P1]WAX08326.1 hypothetical protein BM127P2_00047 [Phocaeicola phage BM127P2]WAX08369.1 hypothetical protein BM127P3_00043 [Phocaeicola phage BM127P3]WAX08420.1 hypothetical protein BM127P4_00047 [Phocaeicola phage BM127P4]